jgi:hypothetical protein
LRDFADNFSLPLLFAVRFLRFKDAAMWVLVEDTDRTKPAVRIDISHWIEGQRSILWDEHSYFMFPNTRFEAIYSPDGADGLLRHSDYGEQVEFHVITSKGRFPQTGTDALLASAFFESYGLKEVASEREGSLVRVAYTPTNAAMSVADMIYAMNRLPRDEEGALIFDAATALRELADGHPLPLVDRQLVEHLGSKYCEIAALGIAEYGEPQARYERWLASGGRETVSEPGLSEGPLKDSRNP